MRWLIILSALLGLLRVGFADRSFDFGPSVFAAQNEDAITTAFKKKQSGVQVSGSGKVIRVLADDTEGSRHQRFILRLPSDQTILVAHNIDVAPRVESLKVGDTISFYGVYEWSSKGGAVHWTHHDPQGKHVGGWLKKGNKTYK